MPTVSESQWLERKERIEQAIKEYIEAKPLDVDDSIDVLGARLFGLGLRGDTLRTELFAAQARKLETKKASALKAGGRSLNYHATIIAKFSRR